MVLCPPAPHNIRHKGCISWGLHVSTLTSTRTHASKKSPRRTINKAVSPCVFARQRASCAAGCLLCSALPWFLHLPVYTSTQAVCARSLAPFVLSTSSAQTVDKRILCIISFNILSCVFSYVYIPTCTVAAAALAAVKPTQHNTPDGQHLPCPKQHFIILLTAVRAGTAVASGG